MTYEARSSKVLQLCLGALALRTQSNALKKLRPHGDPWREESRTPTLGLG